MWRWMTLGLVVITAGCGSNLGKIENSTVPISASAPPANPQKGLAPTVVGSTSKAPGKNLKPGGGVPGKK